MSDCLQAPVLRSMPVWYVDARFGLGRFASGAPGNPASDAEVAVEDLGVRARAALGSALKVETKLPMYPDFKELLSVLNAHRVKYLVVGAYAVSIHAQPRATKDLDVLVPVTAFDCRAPCAASQKTAGCGPTHRSAARSGPQLWRTGHGPHPRRRR